MDPVQRGSPWTRSKEVAHGPGPKRWSMDLGSRFCPLPLLVHHYSAIPKKSKINFIRNERKRFQDRCSTKISTAKHKNAFDDILRQNGYPENSIDQTKRPQSHRRDSQPTNTEWFYLKLSYILERLNYRITNIFRKENIPVRVAHRSHTLRRALSHNSTERTCIRDKCPISNTKLCLRRNAVYQITCKNCNERYIGRTTRFIHASENTSITTILP